MDIKKSVYLAVFITAVSCAWTGPVRAQDRGGGREDGQENSREHDERAEDRGGQRAGQPAWEGRSIIKMQNIPMSRPERLEPRHVVNDDRRITPPRRYENGEEIRERSARVPPVRHGEVADNEGILRSIGREHGEERAHNRYYWHNFGGRRYSHFRDDDDIDWYGFYFGPSFYWTRYYGDRWWWYDPDYARWVFWWNGYWWWQGPGGLAYVYMDNNYYPYQEGGVTVQKSTTIPPAEATPVPGQGKQWTSPDLRRMVEVTGVQNAAFLYDRTLGHPVLISYLGRDVTKVRFSGGAAGQPLQILLDFKDGTFALFDADGKSEKPLPAAPPLTAPGTLPDPVRGSTAPYAPI